MKIKTLLLTVLLSISLVGVSYADFHTSDWTNNHNDTSVFNQGVKAYNDGDYQSAFNKWKSLTDFDEDDLFSHFDFDSALGNPIVKVPGIEARAEYEIGALYENGLGVLKNYNKAGKYYEWSAKWNYPQGQLASAKLRLKVLDGDLIEGLTKENKIEGYGEAAKFISKLYENERATDEMRKEAEELWTKYELHKYLY